MILSGPGSKIYYIPEALYKYNKHGHNITQTQFWYRIEHIEAIKLLQHKYPLYKNHLFPAIYDFCCIGFFKSLAQSKYKFAMYFLHEGLKASNFNIFKFLRITTFAIRGSKRESQIFPKVVIG